MWLLDIVDNAGILLLLGGSLYIYITSQSMKKHYDEICKEHDDLMTTIHHAEEQERKAALKAPPHADAPADLCV